MSDVKELAKKEGEIVEYETETGKVRLSPEIIKKFLVSGDASKVTDAEVFMFLKLCQHQRLNPFLREAYLIKYSDKEPATIVVGKETFTKRAAKSELCAGWQAGVIVKKDETLEYRTGTLVLPDEELVGGWAKVYRKDWKEPLEVSVSMQEYVRRKKDGTLMRNWAEMPATMIRKVALTQALREAFPEQFTGMYSAEEMPVDSTLLPSEPVSTAENYQQEPATLHTTETVSASYTPLPAKETRTEEIQQTTQSAVQPAVIELHNVVVSDDPVIMKSRSGKDYMKTKVITDEGEFEIFTSQEEIMEQFEKGVVFSKVIVKKLSSGMLFVTSIEE